MSADLLRRAAAKIRSTATLASRELGPDWFGGRSAVENHVNLWDPSTAELVAEVLDETVRAIEFHEVDDGDVTFGAELTLALRILGEGE